ncbi:EH signature domain-containing protein [Sulfitobacter mediterraneus]|uniref:EH signature domain-containing protein n=1 Tax=Sulfitobacter mediterraneus TaxID=83219 RepID=UPI0021A4467E|nr:EH signature domain-containing protein [Sulfitobacter mediterraneus]UWR10923.1 hypothetical protein K3753_16990 [Sulfitobacter mediterraneus]
MTRWPDAVRTPEDRDREKLAQNMLLRVSDWNWQNITTQRVISAAVAVFDNERCNRPDLLDVREFYLSEISSREPGAFLDGMVGVYIDSFQPDADHTRNLANALSMRSSDLGGRHQKLITALPQVFTPDDAPQALAQVMLETEDAYTKLKSIGLSSPHTSGLAKAAHKTFIKSLRPDLAKAHARQKAFNWLTPKDGPVLQAGAGLAVEALLSVWHERTPPDELRNELSEAIIAAWNDPRLHAGGIWSGFDPDLRAVLLRWLTHQDMKFFCNMVTATQNSHMWPPRRDFWLKLYDEKMIDEAWVAFGSEARRYAENNLLRGGKTDMNRRFARQLDRGGSTSLLIMRIGNKIIVDGCHSYKTHIFRIDDINAPALYKRQYYCDDIMRASRNSKPHNSIQNWSQWVLQHV